MGFDSGKIYYLNEKTIEKIGQLSNSIDLDKKFFAFCSECGFSGLVPLSELFVCCQKCTQDGNSIELDVLMNTPNEAINYLDQPYCCASEITNELSGSLFNHVRAYLNIKKTHSFKQFLDSLHLKHNFKDIFSVLYGSFRTFEHISLGYRTAAWHMLEGIAIRAFPEYESAYDLTMEMERYSCSINLDWANEDIDIGQLDDWMEIRLACDLYLESKNELSSVYALGLACLVMDTEYYKFWQSS